MVSPKSRVVGEYGASIYWNETAPRFSRPVLTDRTSADVAVIGAGFTGLWTALHLLEAEPTLRVVVLEANEVGFGASGRNGGFAMTLLDMSLAHLRRNHGDSRARAAHEAVAESVDEIGQAIADHAIDCEWVQGGLLVVATNEGQLGRVDADAGAADALGLAGFKRLSADEVQAEVHSPAYLGALYEAHCGVVHPAKLVQGLARVAESQGAAIFERTPVDDVASAGAALRVSTPEGEVVADQVVLATNAWAVSTPWFRRNVAPLYTYIALTEPLRDDQWRDVGWEQRQGIEDKRNYVHYYRRTADGRILWGGSDGVIYFGGAIDAARDRNRRVQRRLHKTFRETFPQLDAVRFTHNWGGPVGITAAFLPIFGTLLEGRLHYGLAYNGHGVAPAHTGGKILRDKVLGRASAYTDLCFVDAPAQHFPPEPLRWIGAELTRRALLRQDAQFDRGAGVGEMDPLLLRLVNKLG